MKQMHFKSASFELTEAGEDRVVKGYASVFNNVDSDNDVIKKGSFNRTIKAWGPEGKNRIKLVSQHNMAQPVARIDVLKEDDKGLYMEATFGTHQAGEDHYRMVKEGILTEFSVGFVPTKYSDNKADGIDIEEIKLYEVSLVTVAANDEALVTDVKAIKEQIEQIKELDDRKEKHHQIDGLLMKLATVFDIEATQPVEETLDPAVETKQDNELESLHKAFFNTQKS